MTVGDGWASRSRRFWTAVRRVFDKIYWIIESRLHLWKWESEWCFSIAVLLGLSTETALCQPASLWIGGFMTLWVVWRGQDCSRIWYHWSAAHFAFEGLELRASSDLTISTSKQTWQISRMMFCDNLFHGLYVSWMWVILTSHVSLLLKVGLKSCRVCQSGADPLPVRLGLDRGKLGCSFARKFGLSMLK